jgi:hypothetical protein
MKLEFRQLLLQLLKLLLERFRPLLLGLLAYLEL